jgi:uncharacterized protein (DUF302 family)
MSTQQVPHEVVRMSFDVAQDYEAFRDRYEEAVPGLATTRLAELIEKQASWDAITANAATAAPHGFFIFWRSDHTPLMTLAGDPWMATSYLMGNHVVAEQMYRHDPEAMLYAPLRVTIHADVRGATRFAIDKPSSVFASFENPAIAEVGVQLDKKLAKLLDALEVEDSSILVGSVKDN